MQNPSVYLAGPITGCSYKGATDWRTAAQLALSPIIATSPMREKHYLEGESFLDAMGSGKHSLSDPRAITARDRFDCINADVLLVNLLGAETISAGTMIELGWADLKRIPIVLCMEDDGIHNHAMVNSLIDFRATTLDDGILLVRHILDVYLTNQSR